MRRVVVGARLFVTSAELWSTAVRWHVFQAVLPPHDPARPALLYEMSDDAGTEDQSSAGGG